MKEDILQSCYEKYYQKAYLYALSLCKDKIWAEDIVSEAFLKAMFSMEEETESFLYWLLRVCRNLFLDEVRRRKRRPTEELTDRAAVPEDALATVLKKEKNRRLYRAMASLPTQYEQILLLYYFAELSVKQIAALQGISDTAAKTALFRARVRLRKEWEAEGYDL